MKEAIEIIDKEIMRLSGMFTIQTQEVIPELNKIKELLITKPQEVKIEPQEEEIKDVELPFKTEIDNKIEIKAKEYLKENKVK
jgi:hypothetical protein